MSSYEVTKLADVLGDIRVEGARQADWWTNDEDHVLLAQVLRAECVPWAEGLLASDWLAERERRAVLAAATDLERRMAHFPMEGRHTRAKWAVAMLRLMMEKKA